MSTFLISFIDSSGKKDSVFLWVSDLSESDLLKVVNSYLFSLQKKGYHLLRVEVL